MGDVHGEFGLLNSFIAKKHPKIIIVCGDFGYWPRLKDKPKNPKYPKKPKTVIAGNTKVYFCDGNHEDHWSLRRLENNEIYPNVFYMKRGSILTLEDGRNVLFMGGAQSIDKDMRIEGRDWFREEEITLEDINRLPDANTKIDIVISHTCPEEMLSQLPNVYNIETNDWSRKALSHVFQIYSPSLWYFGHFHTYKTFYVLGCRWTCLNMLMSSQWYEKLKDKEKRKR